MKKTKLIVLGLVENERGEFLLSQRNDPDVPEAHLKWDFLGGKNEFGESLEKTLEREIFEEAGLRVRVGDMFPKSISRVWDHTLFDLHVVVFCHHCKLVSGETHLNDPKIYDLKWVKKEELADYDFLPTTQFFVDMVLKN
ncbi:MAG: NUDIX domain-containing protein [Candidatus Moranbacteria bacterium]|nr:NUDIX domain-containing protein [Candidatus Moranbacteria bacterium]